MASFYSETDSKGYTLRLDVSQSSQDINKNETVVNWALYIMCGGSYFVTRNNYITVNINGVAVRNNVAIALTTSANSSIYIDGGSLTIPHNADGSKVLSASASFTPSSSASYMPTYKWLSGSMTLTTIPRASTVTATDSYVESATSINIARAATSFTHDLSYSFEGLNGSIATGVATSYGWTIPTSFYEKLTDKLSAICTVTCKTYSGTTLIGTKTTTFKISVDVEKNAPLVSATIVDTNSSSIALTGSNSKLVKYVSNANVEITSTAKNGATIISKKVVCGDGKFLNGNGTLEKIESGEFIVSATDSRGITSSVKYTLGIVNYVKLTINADFYRPAPTTGEVAVIFVGNYFDDSFGEVSNTLNVKFRYRKKDDSATWSDYTSLAVVKSSNTYSNGNNPISLGNGFDYKEIYEFEIIATDKIGEVKKEKPYVVAAGETVYDWGKDDFKHNTVVYLKSGNEILDYDIVDEWEEEA